MDIEVLETWFEKIAPIGWWNTCNEVEVRRGATPKILETHAI
jgi:hypothetical protein